MPAERARELLRFISGSYYAGLGAMTLIGATVVVLSLAQRRAEAAMHHAREVSHLAKGMELSARTRNALIEAYLLTPNPLFLRADSNAADSMMARLAELRALEDEPEQRARLERLTSLLERFNAAIGPIVAARPRETVETSARRVLALQDSITGPISTEFREFLTTEEARYQASLARSHRLHDIAAGSLFAELLLVALVLTRFRRRSAEQAEELSRQHEQLSLQATALEEQAIELEQQAEDAQELATELEVANADLQQALDAVSGARAAEAEAHRARAEAFSQLDAALGSAPIGFAFFDRDLRCVRANPVFAQLSGLPPEAHVGKRLTESIPDLAATVAPVFERVLATGEPVLDVEVTGHLSSSAKPRSFLASYYPIRNPEGRTGGVGVVLVETTAHKELEAQLRQAQKMEAVGQLAGGIAHDFNNVLTAIMSFSELLLADMPDGSAYRTDIQEIQAAAARAAGLTRQLLAFSRKQLLQPVPLDLNEVVHGLGEMLRRLLGEDIDLVCRLDENLHAAIADPGQIEQIVMNLAINARDAMPQGGRLTIETANTEIDEGYARRAGELQPGLYVVLSVSDTGCGMSEATQARIFEPFFTTKAPGRGTGLGLSTVYGIVKQSGGHITVYSEENRGTTFRVYLPRAASDAEAKVARKGTTGLPRGTETVLLVEDDPAVRLVAARILARQGYRVLEAPSPGEAELLMSRRPGTIDLLMTDLVLPQMSGRELAEKLTREEPHLRVLYMSGYTDDAVIRRGLLEPGMAFLSKPFTVEDLARVVRATLDGKPAGTAAKAKVH